MTAGPASPASCRRRDGLAGKGTQGTRGPETDAERATGVPGSRPTGATHRKNSVETGGQSLSPRPRALMAAPPRAQPHVVQGNVTGEPGGARCPAPAPAELAETWPRTRLLSSDLAPGCDPVPWVPLTGLTVLSFLFKFHPFSPRTHPSPPPTRSALWVFSARKKHGELAPQRPGGPEASLLLPPSPLTQTPPETPRGRTHPAHPHQTTHKRTTKTKAAQPMDQAP